MKTIGKYTVLETLDESGLGDVFLAGDTVLGRKVAIRLLAAPAPAEALRARARREGEAPAEPNC